MYVMERWRSQYTLYSFHSLFSTRHSLMRLTPAFRVPPVAIRSSTSTTLCPGCTEPSCISIASELYSVLYSSPMRGPVWARNHAKNQTQCLALHTCRRTWHKITWCFLPAVQAVLPGSFPGFRRGTKAAPRARAKGAPKISPRASKPALKEEPQPLN